MKIDVTYAFISGALFVYTDSTAENSIEKQLVKNFGDAVQFMIRDKLKGLDTDDGNFLGINFNEEKQKNVEIIIKRVVNTVSIEFKCPFKLNIKYVRDEYDK